MSLTLCYIPHFKDGSSRGQYAVQGHPFIVSRCRKGWSLKPLLAGLNQSPRHTFPSLKKYDISARWLDTQGYWSIFSSKHEHYFTTRSQALDHLEQTLLLDPPSWLT